MWDKQEIDQISKAIDGTNIFLPSDLNIVEIAEDDTNISSYD